MRFLSSPKTDKHVVPDAHCSRFDLPPFTNAYSGQLGFYLLLTVCLDVRRWRCRSFTQLFVQVLFSLPRSGPAHSH